MWLFFNSGVLAAPFTMHPLVWGSPHSWASLSLSPPPCVVHQSGPLALRFVSWSCSAYRSTCIAVVRPITPLRLLYCSNFFCRERRGDVSWAMGHFSHGQYLLFALLVESPCWVLRGYRVRQLSKTMSYARPSLPKSTFCVK